MLRATALRRKGDWSGAAADTVVLDFDHRHRRRMAMTGVNGLAFLLDLAEAEALADGDGLVLDDGRLVAVSAAAEPLAEVTCDDTDHLVRVAWHLGNRHLPTELLGDRLRIRRDHVIEDMLVKLGATVSHVSAPFNPEGGAYGHGRTHGHDHGDDHAHDHHHGHGSHSHG
ncbi:MAG TPA: urease accessory protein UreE [Rhodospirillaceae bacterium]|nr:urease accessory protein UreE [Magnetovibrio sp.]HCS69549.1 urease accessory protein UreE [Rhodospirillaceae bacterium]|tara:strand:- start:6421 stop:6930 length:510 start_codon:yes stop_codon:yes gene_type:complete